MPVITVESGHLTSAQKSELIAELTRVSSKITNIPPEFFFVSIRELSDENIGIGGKTIDTIKKAYHKAD